MRSSPSEQREQLPASVWRTLGIVRPAGRRLAMASALGAGAIGASIALMGTSAWLLSRAAQHPSEAALTLAIVGVQFFGLSRGFCRYGERLVGHDAAFHLLAEVRTRFFRELERLAPAGLPLFRRGDLLARAVDDVDALQDLVLRVLPPFVVAAVVGAGTVGVLWALLPGAGAALLVALGISATVVPWLTGHLAKREESRQASVRGELQAHVIDLIEGAPELVVLGATHDQLSRIEVADHDLRSIARSGARTTGVGLGLTTALCGLACWAGLALGVGPTHAGRLNGVLLAVVALVPLATAELVTPLPAATQAFQRCRLAAERVFNVGRVPTPVDDPKDPLPTQSGPHTLDVRSMCATYPQREEAVLRDIDLSITPGYRIAVVGPSGAGKSTLANVLVRFLPFQSGQITLDGTALDRLEGDDVRRVIGLVDQNPHLFSTTLAANLRIAKPSASDTDLAAILHKVGLGNWLADLPKGLATQVGDFGRRLSGGQRQRVAVARAILADFPILILDEPAEHLDPSAADALTADLLGVTGGHATILITHRLTGLEQADEIIVLDGGGVIERGDHASLLAAGGRYAAMWWEEMMTAHMFDLSAGLERSATSSWSVPPTPASGKLLRKLGEGVEPL